MKRRTFLKQGVTWPWLATAAGAQASASRSQPAGTPAGRHSPGRIENEFTLFLPGERESLEESPRVLQIGRDRVRAALDGAEQTVRKGESLGGWQMLAAIPNLDGAATAVFEKHVTHRGVIVYSTQRGEAARIPKHIGELSRIRPRPIQTTPGISFERPAEYVPGPDVLSDYILNSDQDPCYENMAALGAELVGWALVANEETGPQQSLWLEADGVSRQFGSDPQSLWAPDMTGRQFDPRRFLPSEYLYDYARGYSKRTLLGGYLPAADIGVWNPKFQVGYEVMMVLPPGAEAKPIGRIRAMLPRGSKQALIPEGDTNAAAPHKRDFEEHYWNGSAEDFFSALAAVWNKWRSFFERGMQIEIPDEWLMNTARAGIVMARCSYHRYEPTYQIGEGAYTKIPVRSHALFPVAHYEFVWAQQIWNLAKEAEPYFEFYLDHYILPDGNFLYNTQDQVEAPLDAGVFLENSARAYDYTRDVRSLRKRLPVLRRMIDFLAARYRYSKRALPPDDPRHGLIWGSPEADKGDPDNDRPDSHPFYFQNASWTWRGLTEHGRCLERAAADTRDGALHREAIGVARLAAEMRADIERSLKTTMNRRSPAMKQARITPFDPSDIDRDPMKLSSYENHRYMMDWWTSDWGDAELDAGHFRHRSIAGMEILGMGTDGAYPRVSNFMEHGTLAGKIRRDDYRSYLVTLYALACYAMDCGTHYSPEDALLPGNYPGEGSPYAWSAVVNSVLQPTMGLRWMLCHEEHFKQAVHLQKAAPKQWFAKGQTIRAANCPTRFGNVSWATESVEEEGGRPRWKIAIEFSEPFEADLIVHIHPPKGEPLESVSFGELQSDRVLLRASALEGKTKIQLEVS